MCSYESICEIKVLTAMIVFFVTIIVKIVDTNKSWNQNWSPGRVATHKQNHLLMCSYESICEIKVLTAMIVFFVTIIVKIVDTNKSWNQNWSPGRSTHRRNHLLMCSVGQYVKLKY
jgi:putative effector of murein hydrolase LrgA (UPF0299 family)